MFGLSLKCPYSIFLSLQSTHSAGVFNIIHNSHSALRTEFGTIFSIHCSHAAWNRPRRHNSKVFNNRAYFGTKEGSVLLNDAFNTFYLRLYGIGRKIRDHSDSERETRYRYYMGYSFRLAARVILYALSH